MALPKLPTPNVTTSAASRSGGTFGGTSLTFGGSNSQAMYLAIAAVVIAVVVLIRKR